MKIITILLLVVVMVTMSCTKEKNEPDTFVFSANSTLRT